MLQKIKYCIAIVLFAGFFANTAAAETISQEDMAFAFSDSPVNYSMEDVELLSNQEMIETEGEFLRLFAMLLSQGPAQIFTNFQNLFQSLFLGGQTPGAPAFSPQD